jgi:hypothetical protein
MMMMMLRSQSFYARPKRNAAVSKNSPFSPRRTSVWSSGSMMQQPQHLVPEIMQNSTCNKGEASAVTPDVCECMVVLYGASTNLKSFD